MAAPSGAPKGAGFGRDAPPGATADNKGSVGPTYQAQGRPANLSLFAPERGALADAADYLPNPVHDLPPAARAAMNRGYVYSGAFILGGGLAGRLTGWALARLGFGAAEGASAATLAEISAGRSLQAGVQALNQAGATQVQALAALRQIVANKGMQMVAGTIAGSPSTAVLAGVQAGEGAITPAIAVAADGAATFGSGTVQWVKGALQIIDFVPK